MHLPILRFLPLAILLGLLGGGILQFAHSSQENLKAIPAVDQNCEVPSQTRAERLRFLTRRIEDLRKDSLQIKAERAKLEDAVKTMNLGYRVSRVGRVTSEAAGLYLGYGALKTAIQGREVIKVAGQVIPLLLGQSITLHSLIKSSDLVEGKLDREFRNQLTQLVDEPFELQDSLDFMTRPHCGPRECGVYSSQIERLSAEIDQWHTDAVTEHEANAGWGFLEFMHRSYGTRISQLDLPWASAHLVLMNARIAYLELVRLAMIQDQGACLFIGK